MHAGRTIRLPELNAAAASVDKFSLAADAVRAKSSLAQPCSCRCMLHFVGTAWEDEVYWRQESGVRSVALGSTSIACSVIGVEPTGPGLGRDPLVNGCFRAAPSVAIKKDACSVLVHRQYLLTLGDSGSAGVL